MAEEIQPIFRGGPVGRSWRRRGACYIFGEGREGAWRRKGVDFIVPCFRGGPGEGVAEEAVHDTGAGRRAAAEGR